MKEEEANIDEDEEVREGESEEEKWCWNGGDKEMNKGGMVTRLACDVLYWERRRKRRK